MKTILIDLPDGVDEHEARILFAAKLYEKGSVSLGQAAEMAGHPKRKFIELLGSYNVSVFAYSEEDLKNDITNAQNYNL